MVVATSNVSIKLVSNSGMKRAGLMPLAIGIGLGWAFACVWFCVGVAILSGPNSSQLSVVWSLLVMATTLAFIVYLGLVSYSIVQDALREYIFELSDSEAVLVVIDKLRKKRFTAMVLLDDVTYAEYYPYTDSACLIFHTSYMEMEVPLWPMGPRSQDVLDYLAGRGIRVVNVQFDDKIPDLIP